MRNREQAAVKIKSEYGTKRQHPGDLGGEDEDEDEVSITEIVTPDMERARIVYSADAAEVIDITGE
jgi:hypothetical protein